MPEPTQIPLSCLEQVELACGAFEREWKAGRRPLIATYLTAAPPTSREQLLVQLYLLDAEYRQRAGENVQLADYAVDFPDLGQLLATYESRANSAAATLTYKSQGEGDGDASPPTQTAPHVPPPTYGRYLVGAPLGGGTFGVVYRGRDPQLERDVAIKVARREQVTSGESIARFLDEARTMAGLDHAGIVPVYDCGQTDVGECFIVSKLVEGSDLRTALEGRRFTHFESARLVARVAAALHAAHKRGIVHRDVKPANILLDQAGLPLVGDFGLALQSDGFGSGPEFCGTAAYMSPEQAQARSDKVDARSDIYALGIVFYELLTGRRPYRSKSPASLVHEIADEQVPVRPPRQIAEDVPLALEAIVLKALAKRQEDRYSTAQDMAAELERWLAFQTGATPSWRVSRWHVSAAVLAAAVVALFIAAPWNEGTQREQPSPGAGHPADASEPPRITSVEIQQLVRNAMGQHERRGLVLKDAYLVRERDGVQFRARLSRPAYCYWLAFRPDGVEELCFPADPNEPPPRTDAPVYPIEDVDGTCYGFTDGPGLQALLLVVSEQPLPPYTRWKELRGTAPWTKTSTTAEPAILRHDGNWIESFGTTTRGQTRGKGERYNGAEEVLTNLVRWAKTDDRVTAVEAWALPVLPRP